MKKYKGRKILSRFQELNKCEKNAFVDSKGDIRRSRCGRRSCPLCSGYYAWKISESLRLKHGDYGTHIVLTVDDRYIEEFAKEHDYSLSKNFHRVSQKANYWNNDRPQSPGALKGARARIKLSARRAHRGCLKIREAVAAFLDVDPDSLGWVRSTEFGERRSHRYHVHYVLLQNWDTVKIALEDQLQAVIHKDRDRGVWYASIPDLWKYGMIRFKPVENAKGAVCYVTEYMTKSPGRVTVDQETRKHLNELKEVYASDPDDPVEYFPIGSADRYWQQFKGEVYEQLRKEVKHDEDNGLRGRNSKSRTDKTITRRLGRFGPRKFGYA